jgi:hypothetical protein
VLPAGHRLAAQKAVRVQDFAEETYITPTRVAPALKAVIENYAAKSGVVLKPEYDAENRAFAGDIDRRRNPAAALREADAAGVSDHSSAARRSADHRVGARLQPVEHVGIAQAVLGEGGSVDCRRREARRGFFVREYL